MSSPIKEIIKLAIANLDQIQDRAKRAQILEQSAALIEHHDPEAAQQYRTTAAFIIDSEKHQLTLIQTHRSTPSNP